MNLLTNQNVVKRGLYSIDNDTRHHGGRNVEN